MFSPRNLFEFPILQYIPIVVEDIYQGFAPGGSQPILRVIGTAADLAAACRRLGWPMLPWLGKHEQQVFLLEGGVAKRCYYRAHDAMLVGDAAPGRGQLFRINTSRIYKDQVKFTLYDEAGRALTAVEFG